ncbi:hypothetical protein [Leucobacter sp. M11]|nr:hypothetical protein [Leucobacter sp. M11]MEB4616455.1 hypothetical protein [Leucobacter sp. M11]
MTPATILRLVAETDAPGVPYAVWALGGALLVFVLATLYRGRGGRGKR